MDWKNDDFLRMKLSDRAPSPKAVKDKKFDRQITFVVKPKSGMVYRKSCPEWAKETVEKIISSDANTDRYIIEEN